MSDGYYAYSLGSVTGDEQKVNAWGVHDFLSNLGWTEEAIAGAVGNMQAESGITPARWESNKPPITDSYELLKGYSLTQWTNWHKFTDWAYDRDEDARTLTTALKRIKYEQNNNLQWYAKAQNNYTTWAQYVTLTDVNLCAKAWAQNYEVPQGWNTDELIKYRQSLARNWYQVFTGETPPTPPSGGINVNSGSGKIMYYMKNRNLL